MKEEAKKGFSYTVSDEQLDEYRKWPPERKLKWLYEANRMRKNLPWKIIEIRSCLERGRFRVK